MKAYLQVLTVILSALVSAAHGQETPVKLEAARVNKLIEQLKSDDFTTRVKAAEELSNLDYVPDALREAARGKDLEVGQRSLRR